jgi:glycosyltransferase involved in cell wall biosynthesis
VGRDKWELLFIDDGSSDGSSELLRESAQGNNNIRVYSHQARSGQAQAFNTGFRNSAGRLVVTMDADLQVFPEDLPLFFQKIEEGYDAVNGYRRNRKDSPLINFYSFIFNIFVRTLLSSCVSDAASNYTAIKRQFIDGLELSGNDHRYIIPIVKRRGGIRVAEVVIRHQRRQKGKSKYKLTKCLNAFPEIISFWFRLRSGGYDSNSG